MGELKNVTLTVGLSYDEKDDIGLYTGKPYLMISIPLPGGNATYNIPITEAIRKNLIAASKLSETE